MSIATMMKTISDSANLTSHIIKENKWESIADREYIALACKIKESAKKGYYFVIFEPDLPYETYYLIYTKLENDGFRYKYDGCGYIIVWWNNSDGKEYERFS